MKKIMVLCALLVFGMVCFCYCETPDIAALVDNFAAATDLQRDQIRQDYIGKEISCAGSVGNAQEYDFFDTVNDIQGTYYQVVTEPEKSKNNTPYQVVLLFRSKDEAKDLNKGDAISKSGKIIRIDDERLQIAVWLFCGDLTEKDKDLFNKNP